MEDRRIVQGSVDSDGLWAGQEYGIHHNANVDGKTNHNNPDNMICEFQIQEHCKVSGPEKSKTPPSGKL